jgi:uncharacterized protein (DUF169 family)
MNNFKVISDEYRSYLGLQGFPVAVKMIADVGELDKIYHKGKPATRLSKNLLVCQLLAQARFYGRVIAGEEKNLNLCRLGADAMGFDIDDYAHVYSGTYFSTEEAARRMIDTMPKFEKGKYHAMVVAPLDKSPVEPDVVLIYGNAAQMLRIINGYLYNKGGRLEFSASGDAGVCCDPLVIPVQTGKPSIGIPCNGGRIMSIPNETDFVFGIPFQLLEEVLDGVKYTGIHVPVSYPTAWQHIDWEPQPPILYFIRPELPRA